MNLVDTITSEDERTSPDPATIEVYVPKAKANKLSTPAPLRVRKGQRLDVDGILARSLPNLGAYSPPEVKTRLSR